MRVSVYFSGRVWLTMTAIFWHELCGSIFSPDVILCGWLGSKHQLTNHDCAIFFTWFISVNVCFPRCVCAEVILQFFRMICKSWYLFFRLRLCWWFSVEVYGIICGSWCLFSAFYLCWRVTVLFFGIIYASWCLFSRLCMHWGVIAIYVSWCWFFRWCIHWRVIAIYVSWCWLFRLCTYWGATAIFLALFMRVDVSFSGCVCADGWLWQRDSPWLPGLRGDCRHQFRTGVPAQKITRLCNIFYMIYFS